MPNNRKNYLSELVYLASEKYKLDYKLVAAIILQESRGDKYAFRYEPGFYNRYLGEKPRNEIPGFVPKFPPNFATEKRARAFSWGVMQIMGETAREHGFVENNITRLIEDDINVEYGCKYLAYLFKKFVKTMDPSEKTRQVLKGWNGADEYPDIIFGHLRSEEWKEVINEKSN